MKKTVYIGVDPLNPEPAKITYYSVCSHLNEGSKVDVRFMNPLDMMKNRTYHKDTLLDYEGKIWQTSEHKKEKLDVLHRKCRFYAPFMAPKGLCLFLTDKLLVKANVEELFDEYLEGDPYMVTCVKYSKPKYPYSSDVILFDTKQTPLQTVLNKNRIKHQKVSGLNEFAWINRDRGLRDAEIQKMSSRWNWHQTHCNSLDYENAKIINFTDVEENQDYLDEKFMYVYNDLMPEYKKLSSF